MKAFIFSLISFALSTSAFGAQLQGASQLQNSALERAAQSTGDNIRQGSFRVAAPTPARGRSAAAVRLATIEQAAHLLCGFFDDGVNVTQMPAVNATVQSAVHEFYGQDEEGALGPALGAAMDTSLEFYAGDASGNNTSGQVIGVYDLAHDEILVFANTNCGSDD